MNQYVIVGELLDVRHEERGEQTLVEVDIGTRRERGGAVVERVTTLLSMRYPAALLGAANGSVVAASGSVSSRKWTSRDGRTRSDTTAWLDRIEVLSAAPEPTDHSPLDASGDDDIPF